MSCAWAEGCLGWAVCGSSFGLGRAVVSGRDPLFAGAENLSRAERVAVRARQRRCLEMYKFTAAWHVRP